ncbi:MAG: fibronectin type III domain-containing protein, partial [Chloroflexi bacterium]|nr:fibronectin type III domain-containing protein [Chloroflexota bacterium]
ITDDDDDAATIAFSNDAAASSEYMASVDENITGGMLDVPVTISHLPGSSITFAVEVLTTGTATEYVDSTNPGDFRITTKTVTFGPTDTTRTQTISVAITNDTLPEADETIKLRIVAADIPIVDLEDRYGRHASGSLATLTITNDDVPEAPTNLLAAPGDQTLALTWNAPTLPDGTLLGYDVHYTSVAEETVADDAALATVQSPTAADGWVDASHDSTTASQTITGLDNGTPYRVRVRATNDAGDGAWVFGSGTPAPTTTYAITSMATVAEGMTARLTVTLGEAAPENGLALSVAYGYSVARAAASADLSSPPSSVTVLQGTTTVELAIPLASDDLVEGDETFTVTLSTSVDGWVEASEGANVATVTITDDDDDTARIAFGTDATSTMPYTASVLESTGVITVPVTVSHFPGAETTFSVEVTGGSATVTTDYVPSLTVDFGPDDTLMTKKISIAIINDTDLEVDETIELRIVAADNPVNDLGDYYDRHASGGLATLTITNDETPPAPTNLQASPGNA